jgi:hypothetical protein
MTRPMMWLIGMKFRVIAGSLPSVSQAGPNQPRRQQLAISPSVYIAPFGVPVEPEV